MTDKRTIPLGKGPRSIDDFVRTGAAHEEHHADNESKVDVEREVTKTFRMPASLGRRLKVYAVRTGQKEKDILIRLIADYLEAHDTAG
jgi:hypothetical protein